MKIDIVTGNILDQKTDVIVNSWNRNVIPWWLLLPQGVSGAIKKQGGTAPFKEVAKCSAIPLGEARLTSAGRLPYQAIIHVAGINLLWFATEYSVTKSVFNAMKIVNENQFQSVAFPLIATVLKIQEFLTFASHCFPSLTMVLRMMSSLCMAATSATIFGFPFLTSVYRTH
ncbi:O-acetyl-ADP-ribose deacetylase [Gimesia fumaroli]|uniref:O-acetyl-ADP-ribose deacetylase n=1 Tax=Gimesia fumaroli TaxID=2527976 RepID=A0A518ILP3_9PLAN|nr:O-acetyl-ADP-ribose deacetylase [Gimesia fumaroli]